MAREKISFAVACALYNYDNGLYGTPEAPRRHRRSHAGHLTLPPTPI